MSEELWTIGMVGPERRAIMHKGAVVAIAGSENEARKIVRRMNAPTPDQVRVILRSTDLGGIFTPDFVILAVPNSGVRHNVPTLGVSVEVTR